MSTHKEYARVKSGGCWDLSCLKAAQEIAAAIPAKPVVVTAEGTVVSTDFVDTLTGGEITTLDALIAAIKAEGGIPPELLSVSGHLNRICMDLDPDALYYLDGADRIVDQTGNGYGLTLTGTVTDAAGFRPGDMSTRFEDNGYLQSTHADFRRLGSISVMILAKLRGKYDADPPYQRLILCSGFGASENENALWSMYPRQGKVNYACQYGAGSGSELITDVKFDEDQWALYGMTRSADATDVKLFMNGLKIAESLVMTAPTGGSNSNMLIGKNYSSEVPFKGYVDCAAIWFSELSEAEMLAEAQRVLNCGDG